MIALKQIKICIDFKMAYHDHVLQIIAIVPELISIKNKDS